MEFGLETLGGFNFEKEIWQNVPKTMPIKLFASELGNGLHTANMAGALGYRTIEMQAVWSHHNHTFGNPELLEAIEVTKKFARLQSKYGFRGFLSPFCEHKNSAKVMREVMKKLLPHAGGVKLVNCPMQGGELLEGFTNEVHGKFKPKGLAEGNFGPFIYGLDGLSTEDCDIQKLKEYWKLAQIFYLWAPPCNGKKEDIDETPYPERKNWPYDELIESWLFHITDKGVTHLPEGWIWKTHAEVHNVPNEPRENRPVLISPVHAAHIELVTSAGEVAATLPYSKLYQDNKRYVYRFSGWGYKLARKYGLLSVRANGVIYGIINPGFRENEYR